MSTAVEDGHRPPPDNDAKELPATPLPVFDKDLPPIPEISSAHASVKANGHSTAAHATVNGFPPSSQPSTPSTAVAATRHGADLEAEDYLNGGRPHGNVSPAGFKENNETEIAGDDAETVETGERGSERTNAPSALSDVPAVPTILGKGEVDGLVESPPATPGPRRRRSVQFSQSDIVIEPPPSAPGTSHLRQSSWDPTNPSKSRAFMSRLKALAVQGGLPTSKASGAQDSSGSAAAPSASWPTPTRGSRLVQSQDDEDDSEADADADADAEETADEAAVDEVASRPQKRKRRMRYRRQQSEPQPAVANGGAAARDGDSGAVGTGRVATAPSSPVLHSRHLNMLLQRRATMPEQADHRGGLSEGEGRDHLNRLHGWRRGSSWVGRSEGHDDVDGPSSGRAVGHLRRMTVFGGGVSDGDAMTPRRTFFTGDRATTFGAQKWRQMKNTLKMLRQKKEDRFDYLKSAELMAELRAGAPAVLMLASMIQRDEHGNKRIPVLLEQVKLRISDSAPVQDSDSSERHWLFTIELEYGSGPSRMRWTIKRTIREILELHWKYKLALRNDKYLHTAPAGARPKQPRFPVSAFPYVRGLRGVEIDDEDDGASVRGDDGTAGEGTAGEGTATETENGRTPNLRRQKTRMGGVLGMSRRSSAAAGGPDGSGGGGGGGGAATGDGQQFAALDEAAVRRKYVERQQRMLEKYLNEMIHWLIFRADSNRLCRFLELSALGVRLAAEGSYHGKECFLHIQSSKGLDFRRVLTPGKVIERHSRKWFLVRQSYIVCVESPENMNIYDVYLVDPKFLIISKKKRSKPLSSSAPHHLLAPNGEKGKAPVRLDMSADTPRSKHHTLTILTSERKVKLWGRNQHLVGQFEESMLDMLKQTPWHRRNRFDSFAPVRTGVFAQWLVDGRDYMWNVSRAIAMAKDVIYIHDWWLSPELYMRRPACISQKWRLDRLLQRKASEGVKIFVIIYRNVEAAIPIDSEYTKFSLLNLHPNIFVQRSPNQFKKNQFFFAHHEKICIVDHDVAFLGGIDLCFGRWDSPQHSLVDDKPTGFELDEQPKDADHCQLWPGKDYSNPRVQDFFSLREPYKEMYDRTKVPRMPWHDVGMQVVGQPARDLTRHFVQRWNYVRRGRKPTRPTPFLLPPPDHRPEDLENLGLSGTCEVQILRSASAWSLGITDVECSIQTAYISMIEESEHFVYIENQFFITSTETLNAKIVNRIGDALVDRILRAHRNDEDWRCVILIPLMPGFQNSVADQEGTSVRLILQCQYRSICRGENSIFGRLRAAGIEPEDYIQFFSLRQWGKINNKTVLTTEQLYIHAKTIIVDDRVALIGSANINERSMLGDRDSETAAIVRDRDMIESTMAGQPYRVGRFAHTLRLRLMQEHLGLDTDEIMEDARREAEFQAEMDKVYSEGGTADGEGEGEGEGAGAGGGSTRDSASFRSDVSPGTAAANDGIPFRGLQRVNSFNHNVDLDVDYGATSDEGDGSSRLAEGLSRPWSRSRSRSRSQSLSKPQAQAQAQGQSQSPKAEKLTLTESMKQAKDVEGYGNDHWATATKAGTDRLRDSTVINGREVLLDNSFDGGSRQQEEEEQLTRPEQTSATKSASKNNNNSSSNNRHGPTADTTVPDALLPPLPHQGGLAHAQVGVPPQDTVLPPLPVTDDTDIGGPPTQPVNPIVADIRLARITKDCMRDPLDPMFYDEVWSRAAENNTKIYRRVFRCLPDSEATNWHEFQEFIAYAARFQESMEARKKADDGERTEHGNANGNGNGGGRGSYFARHAGGGGAGISVPAPGALGTVAAVAAVGEKMASAVAHHQHQHPHPFSMHPLHHDEQGGGDGEGDGNGEGENKPTEGQAGHTGSTRGQTTPGSGGNDAASSKAEMEKAAAAENAFKRRPSSIAGSVRGFQGMLRDDGGGGGGDVAVDELDDKDGTSGKASGSVKRNKNRRATFEEAEKPSLEQSSPPPRMPEKDGAGAAADAGAVPTAFPAMTATTTGTTTTTTTATAHGSVKRRRRTVTKGSRRGFQGGTDELLAKADAEELLGMVQGQLVQFPYDWLQVEEGNGNWLYQVDQVAPLQIYN